MDKVFKWFWTTRVYGGKAFSNTHTYTQTHIDRPTDKENSLDNIEIQGYQKLKRRDGKERSLIGKVFSFSWKSSAAHFQRLITFNCGCDCECECIFNKYVLTTWHVVYQKHVRPRIDFIWPNLTLSFTIEDCPILKSKSFSFF